MPVQHTPADALELRQLRQLAAIAESGSINAAAKALAIAQPALSRSLQALEASVGVRLVERTTRGVTVTEYGQSLLRYAHQIEATLRQAAEEMDAIRGVPSATIRVGAGPVEGAAIASVAIDRVLRRYPGANVTVREGLYPALEPLLVAGELDFVVGGAIPTLDGQLHRAGLQFEYIGEMRPCLVVRAQHPLAKKRRVTFRDLQRAEWVIPFGNTLARTRFNRAFEDHGLPPPVGRIAAAVSSWTAVGLILRNDLVALVPQQLIRGELQSGALKALTMVERTLTTPVYLVTREGAFVPPVCRDVIAEIRTACNELSGDVT